MAVAVGICGSRLWRAVPGGGAGWSEFQRPGDGQRGLEDGVCPDWAGGGSREVRGVEAEEPLSPGCGGRPLGAGGCRSQGARGSRGPEAGRWRSLGSRWKGAHVPVQRVPVPRCNTRLALPSPAFGVFKRNWHFSPRYGQFGRGSSGLRSPGPCQSDSLARPPPPASPTAALALAPCPGPCVPRMVNHGRERGRGHRRELGVRRGRGWWAPP